MLNKNANCYNIENNFKYRTVISTFSEHITIIRTFSIDIWQLKCQPRQTNKTKNSKLFSIIKFFFFVLLRKAALESKVAPTNCNSLAFLLHTGKTFSNVELFSIFLQSFLELILMTQFPLIMLLSFAMILFDTSYKSIWMCLNT